MKKLLFIALFFVSMSAFSQGKRTGEMKLKDAILHCFWSESKIKWDSAGKVMCEKLVFPNKKEEWSSVHRFFNKEGKEYPKEISEHIDAEILPE